MYWPISFLADGPSPGTEVTNFRRLVGLWANAHARPLPRVGYNAIPAPATAAFFRKSRRLLAIYFSKANSNDFRTDLSLLFAIAFARVGQPIIRLTQRGVLDEVALGAAQQPSNARVVLKQRLTSQPTNHARNSYEERVRTYLVTHIAGGVRGRTSSHRGNKKGLGDCHSAVFACTGSRAQKTVIVATAAGDDDHSGLDSDHLRPRTRVVPTGTPASNYPDTHCTNLACSSRPSEN